MVLREIFDGRVQMVIGGQTEGDHALKGHLTPQRRPAHNLGRVLALINRLKVNCVVPEPLFTHQIVNPNSDHFNHASIGPRELENQYLLLQPIRPADGCLLVAGGLGAGICNADCPVGILFSPQTGRGCLLHLGLRCLLELDGSPNIIERAIELMGERASRLAFWAGLGIGACCYGYPPGSEMLELVRRQYPGALLLDRRVSKGPRAAAEPAFVAVDLGALILDINVKLGGFDQLQLDSGCSA